MVTKNRSVRSNATKTKLSNKSGPYTQWIVLYMFNIFKQTKEITLINIMMHKYFAYWGTQTSNRLSHNCTFTQLYFHKNLFDISETRHSLMYYYYNMLQDEQKNY
jgi:hypothetical protein